MKRSIANWDGVRVFLATKRAGGLRRGAQSLGISHATLRRRIAAVEADLGLRLFDRRPDGLHLTPEATELVALAEAMEQAAARLVRRASGVSPSLDGWIHVSAPDLLVSELLAPALAAFSQEWPMIKLRIQTTYDLANLGAREADIALRILSVGQQPEGELVGFNVAPLFAAVYGTGDRWVGWENNEEIVEGFPFADLPVVGAFNNVFLQRALCVQGLGLAMLPCFMAPPGLEQRAAPRHVSNVWVLVHPDQRGNPRIRLFREAMVRALKAHVPAEHAG